MVLKLFSSTRKLKLYHDEFKDKNVLLNHAQTIQDFEQKILVSKYQQATNYQSLLIMRKACLQTKELETKLKIPSNFFAFLRNYEYLFSFFKELIQAKKRPSDLLEFDLYAEYTEHLRILDELYTNYFSLLKKSLLSDELSLYMDYELNTSFLSSFDELHLYMDGFLDDFELELFSKLVSFIPLKIYFQSSKFNLEFLKKCSFFKSLSLEADHKYCVDIGKNELVFKEKIIKNKNIYVKSLPNRFLQASFVFAMIYFFIKDGIAAKDIAIITPDEDFTEILRAFDKDGLLSFARGISIKNSSFYIRLNALYNGLKNEFYFDWSEDYFKQEDLDLNNSKLRLYELLEPYKSLELDKTCDFETFFKLVNTFLQDETSELKEKIKLELLALENILQDNLSLRELLELFFVQISKLFISEVRGGQVRVIGLLESRGISIEGLIIIDFNDDLVPKRSSSELFLNNTLRKKAGLISYNDRENLQRHYYLSLISKAKKVGLCYVLNEEKIPSRFLDENEFCLIPYDGFDDFELASYFNEKNPTKLKLEIEPDFSLKIDNTMPLSYTRFSSFSSSKMDYYYKYILKTPQPKQLQTQLNPAKYGLLVHELLEEYFKNFTDFKLELFEQSLDKAALDPLDKELLRYRFKRFEENELIHKNQGFKILACEEKLSSNILNNKLNIQGVIDRIDINEDLFCIIDYKTKLPKNKNNEQLNFYCLLFSEAKNIASENISCCLYDLQYSMKLVNFDANKEKKLLELKNKLADFYEQCCLPILFSPLNDQGGTYSKYKVIYKKELK